MDEIKKDDMIDDDDDDEKLIELMGDIFSEEDDKENGVDDLVLLGKRSEKGSGSARRPFDFEVESRRKASLTVTSMEGGKKGLKELGVLESAAAELPELARDDILNVLKSVPRLGHVMAVSIVDGGFDNYHSLSTLEESDLKEIPGLGVDIAVKIVERVTKEYPPKVKKEQNVEEELVIPVEKIEEVVEPEQKEPTEETKEEKLTSIEESGGEKTSEEEVSLVDGEEKTVDEIEKAADEGKETEEKEKAGDEGKETEKKEKTGVWGKIKGLFARKKGAGEKDEKEGEKEDAESETSSEDELTELEGLDDKETGTSEAEDAPELSDEPTTLIKEVIPSKKEETSHESHQPEDTEKKDYLQLIDETEEEKGETKDVAPPEITGTDSVSPVRAYMVILDVEEELAEKLYSSGYRNLGELKEAIPEDLVYVEGINPTLARKIYAKLH